MTKRKSKLARTWAKATTNNLDALIQDCVSDLRPLYKVKTRLLQARERKEDTSYAIYYRKFQEGKEKLFNRHGPLLKILHERQNAFPPPTIVTLKQHLLWAKFLYLYSGTCETLEIAELQRLKKGTLGGGGDKAEIRRKVIEYANKLKLLSDRIFVLFRKERDRGRVDIDIARSHLKKRLQRDKRTSLLTHKMTWKVIVFHLGTQRKARPAQLAADLLAHLQKHPALKSRMLSSKL